jgi:hypothetical protein
VYARKACLILLLLATLSVATVFATTTLMYDWNVTLTASTPKVRFIKHSDQTLSNTIDLPYNVYADMWTQDTNATYGIKNTDAGAAHTIYLYINAIDQTSKVANVTIWIKSLDGTTIKATITWQGGSLPTTEQSFSAVASTTYMMTVWVKGAATVANVVVSLKMKVAE